MNVLTKKDQNLTNKITYNRLAEAYRILKTNIEFVSIQKDLKTIVFTSTSKSEGKSTTVANYGMTLAEQNKRVLIIDCDLRNPTQHKIFKLKNNYGLTEVLLKRISYDNAIQKTYNDNLSILTTGLMPPNPASILSSERMTKLIGRLQPEYDYIIIDTCPINLASDTSILAAMADGTVLVVRSKQCNREALKRSIKALELAKVNLLGVVLNCVEQDYKDEYYYYNYK